MISELRQELLSSQNLRTDILKWKLILVALIIASSFSFMQQQVPTTGLLALLGIPLVCIYADALYAHLGMRDHAIANFLQNTKEYNDAINYESYSKQVHEIGAHEFEIKALKFLSIASNLAVLFTGWLQYKTGMGLDISYALIVAGSIGISLTLIIFWRFASLKTKITAIPITNE